jgi:hypothetical protein
MRGLKDRFEGVTERTDLLYAGPLWGVAEGYDLAMGPRGKKVGIEDTGEWRLYAPLQEPDLFLSFARLASRGKPSAKTVLRWVSKYGLLRRADEECEDVKLPDGELNQSPVLVDGFAAEALEARSALALYTDLSVGGVEALRKRIGELREEYETGGKLSEMDRYFAREWGEAVGKTDMYPRDNLQFVATALLEGFVRDKLEGVRPALWSGETSGAWAGRYRPTQSWKCPDLLSAVYLQFYLLMTNSLKMRLCENPACHMPIPVTRKNRRFCSSTCRSNMRHYR